MSTKITPFGKHLRILRIDIGETQKQMAQKLNVTAAYLSAVEIGKRSIPDYFCKAIAEAYQLDAKQKTELFEAAIRSRNYGHGVRMGRITELMVGMISEVTASKYITSEQRAYQKGYTDALASLKNKLMNGE